MARTETCSSSKPTETETYGGTLDDSARAMVQTSDGGYIITGTTNSFGTGTYDMFLIKTDSSGNLLWARVYDGPADDVASSVIETMGKDIVVAGNTRSFGAGLHDFLLLKTDSLGNLQWVKTYGGPNEDWAFSVYEAYDHGYIIAGTTESFGAGLKNLPFPSPTDFRYGFCPRGLYPILRRGITGLYGCENRYWGGMFLRRSRSIREVTNPTIITGGCQTTSFSEGCYITVTQPGE